MKIFLLTLSIFLSTTLSYADSQEIVNNESKKPDLSQLSVDEIRVYQSGEISTGTLVGGGLVGTFLGLGIGHAIEGEYGSKGWIFTVGEIASIGLMSAGLTSGVANCSIGNTSGCGNGLGVYTFGAFAYVGFRIWEIIDVWTLPGRHNAEYHAIQEKIGEHPRHTEWGIMPIIGNNNVSGSNYGLSLTASF